MTKINKFIESSKKTRSDKYKTSQFSYGYRYFYWSYYKNNTSIWDPVWSCTPINLCTYQPTPNQGYQLKDWYIEKKYCNLHQELVSNSICHITEEDWNNLYGKALALIKTDHVRSIF